ncbi:MAG TPA: hypothetical protein GXZ21_03600 [Clostridiales bacterium]|nr:hypothetical protein [Clostridiales bacterium]
MSKFDEVIINELATVAVKSVHVSAMEGEVISDGGSDEGMYMDHPSMEAGMGEVKDPLLSSLPFVLGVSGGVLIISIALGAFLASRKIKKGIDLYED